jgi:hypothetical protein
MLLHLLGRGRWFFNGSCRGNDSRLTSVHEVCPAVQERHSSLQTTKMDYPG